MIPNEIELEQEGYTEENPVDAVWVRDGKGRLIRLEVEDDASND